MVAKHWQLYIVVLCLLCNAGFDPRSKQYKYFTELIYTSSMVAEQEDKLLIAAMETYFSTNYLVIYLF